MGRQAAPRQWRLLRSARCVLPVCRLDAGARRGRRGGPDLRARASSRGGGGGAAERPVAGPRRGHRACLAVVRRAAPLLLWQRAAAAREVARARALSPPHRSEEHTSELQSQSNLVCRLLLEKKKK